MAFFICGSDKDKENYDRELKIQDVTPQCFGLAKVNEQKWPPMKLKSFTVVLRRVDSGFGFSVTGSKPAKIKVVKPASSAESAGLCKDDHVMRINDEDVRHHMAENIANIVRNAGDEIILDIERKVPMINRPRESTSLSSRQMSAPENLASPHSESIIFNELSEAEQDRQSLIQDLVHCEQDFLAQMQFGIQRYSEPLRHELISPAEHATLFQNVDKLVSISEYRVCKLEEESIGYPDVGGMFIDNIGSIYQTKVLEMAEVFEQYCNNIKNAFRLLAELKEFQEFEDFLQETPLKTGEPTISAFIQKPLHFITKQVRSLQSVLSQTSPKHQDADSLSQVVNTLKNICNNINENNTRRSMSMTSLVPRSRSSSKSFRSSDSSISSRSSRSSLISSLSSMNCSGSSGSLSVSSSSDISMESSRVSSGSSSIESSVDPEVLDIQARLVFTNGIQPFQLATASRHLIYAGDVTHVDGDQLYVVLMSDLILLTKVEPDERLLVVDHPLLLQDLVSTDFSDTNTLDFCLTVESAIDDEWVEDCDVILTAPSLELKYTWKNLLEQRLKSIQRRRQFLSQEQCI